MGADKVNRDYNSEINPETIFENMDDIRSIQITDDSRFDRIKTNKILNLSNS